jgi:hypothetical protein
MPCDDHTILCEAPDTSVCPPRTSAWESLIGGHCYYAWNTTGLAQWQRGVAILETRDSRPTCEVR